MNLARRFGSPVEHLVQAPSTRTLCDQSTQGMAVWNPSTPSRDRAVRRTCEECRSKANTLRSL